MITSETVKELYTALSKVQSVMASAKRTADNPFFKSKYADLDEVWSVAKKPLTDNGFSVIQFPEDGENDKVMVTCRLCHSSGEWVQSTLSLKPTKQDPQAVGSAITYGRRYLFAAMVGVVTDDDDGNAASEPNGKAAAKPASSDCTDKQKKTTILQTKEQGFEIENLLATSDLSKLSKEWQDFLKNDLSRLDNKTATDVIATLRSLPAKSVQEEKA